MKAAYAMKEHFINVDIQILTKLELFLHRFLYGLCRASFPAAARS